MFIDNYSEFINLINSKLNSLGIDIEELSIDHLSYQTDSAADYDDKKADLKEHSQQISENIVGDRRVGIFQLYNPLNFEDEVINIIEIFEPKAGQKVNSDWEHIEFIVKEELEDFQNKYPKLEWDTSALSRDEFPMLILQLGNGIRAKFPRLGVLEEIERLESKSV